MCIAHCIKMASKGAILPGYKDSISDPSAKQRYEEKLKLISGRDPYEIPREAWKDAVDLWPSSTYIHVGMYLVFSPSPYTGQDLLKYKSFECYQRCTAGWVRDILVSVEGGRRLVIAKVSCHFCFQVTESCKPWQIVSLGQSFPEDEREAPTPMGNC